MNVGGAMDCPNLDSRSPYDPVCRLRSLIYTPSTDEMMVICTTDQHSECPLYLGNLYELETRWIQWGQIASLTARETELEEILIHCRGEACDDKDDSDRH